MSTERFSTCIICKLQIDHAIDRAVSITGGAGWMHVPCSRETMREYLRPQLLAVFDAIAICKWLFTPGPSTSKENQDNLLLVAVLAHLEYRYAGLVVDYHDNSMLAWSKD